MKTGHRDEKLEKTVECTHPGCDKLFINISNMRHHVKKIHEQPIVHRCLECGQIFKRKQPLIRHELMHTGYYPHRCEQCGQGSMNYKEHEKHMQTHKLHICRNCGKIFPSYSDLIEHYQEERKNIHFICDYCNKIFSTKLRLRFHMEVHRDQDTRKSIHCPFSNCGNFYFDKRNLNAHIRSKHEGSKFMCDFCGKVLSFKGTLTKHMEKCEHRTWERGGESRGVSFNLNEGFIMIKEETEERSEENID